MRSTLYLSMLLLGIALSSTAYSQMVSISPLAGKIIKHKSGLLYDVPPVTSGVELTYSFAHNNTAWEQYWKKPHVSLSAHFLSFGDHDVLGSAFALVPSLSFDIYRSDKWQIDCGLGVGIGYITRPYHPITNKNNNAIGSHFNNASQLRAKVNYRITPQNTIGITSGFFHYSNGLTKSPNSGVNVLLGSIQYSHSLSSSVVTSKNKDRTNFQPAKHGIDLLIGRGFTQSDLSGGPTYAVQYTGIQGYRYLSPYIRLLTGMEYEFNQKVFQFFQDDFTDKALSKRKATSFVWTVGGEFFFGKYAARTSVGYYLNFGDYQSPKPIYFKLASHYYFLGRKNKVDPYIGVVLKSHFAAAEYVSIQMGMSI